jgi:hypothetical protein
VRSRDGRRLPAWPFVTVSLSVRPSNNSAYSTSLAQAFGPRGEAKALGVFSLAAPELGATREGIPQLPDETPYGIPTTRCLLARLDPARPKHALPGLALARRTPARPVRSGQFAARLTGLLTIEAEFWKLAAAYGGWTDRMPYFFRLRALGWFWTPDVHTPGSHAYALCIRCEALIPPAATGRPRKRRVTRPDLPPQPTARPALDRPRRPGRGSLSPALSAFCPGCLTGLA